MLILLIVTNNKLTLIEIIYYLLYKSYKKGARNIKTSATWTKSAW